MFFFGMVVKMVKNGLSLWFEIFLAQRHTKTQKYKGALFEQLESGWVGLHAQLCTSVEDETEQKARQGK